MRYKIGLAVAICAAVFPCLAGTPASLAATLATDGKPQMTIVLAEEAIPSERTASEELAGYLAKVTGGKFAVVGEAAAAPGPGYHWHELPPVTVPPSTYVYFFWSWIVQFPIESVGDPSRPEEKFEVWARIKFEGPGFPHGKPEQKNAICVERVIVVRGFT